MAVRNRATFAVLAVACGLAAGAATLAAQAHATASSASAAPREWVIERTPDGHPDFHGVWANNTVTPLQRPKQWEGKERLTDAEVAELQEFAAHIVENDGDAQFGDGFILAVLNRIANPKSYDPGTGNYNQFWLVERDWHDRRTALITDPPSGKIPPMTPEAQTRRAAEIEHRKAHAFEDPEVFSLGERCVNFGIPRLQAGYNSYLQIVQAPGYVTIMNEMAHDARIIPLDGRPHLDGRLRVWNGDSRGHWEGDTLVIDTTNFSPKSDFMGSHENLRLTEKLTRAGPEILNYELTIDDPTTWTAPWTAMIPLKLKNESIYEYACHEGNEAIPDMLRGHRFEEHEAAATAQEHEHGASTNEHLGTVAFATSCSAGAAPQFNRGVALLHSFEFGRAIDAFTATLETDPSCALAAWGIALSRWGNPFVVGIRPAASLQLGRDAIERARTIGAKTDRERSYVAAASRLYDSFETIEQRTRLVAYRDAMAALASAYPDDAEASIFHALAISAVAAASPLDRSYAEPLKAGAILEKLMAKQPDHPGLAHYVIHSYDYPPLADHALEAARRYAKIAPDSPHARHMPSHTFTRVGYWQESIDANVASGAVARRDGVVGEELHAMDYRTYAYLQTAQDAQARAMVDALPEVVRRFNPNATLSAAPPSAAIFAMAAIPARYALERGAWAEAAQLTVYPSSYPYTEALTHLARAVGAAHTGNTATAKSSIEALQQIASKLADQHETYWAEQVEIQRREATAWLALAEGRKVEALAEMRAAAALEDGTEKSAVTPGPLAPARELLGEMLLQLSQPADALKEFETTLKKEPNRFRAVYGAGKAAALAGNRAKARTYYGQLLKICERSDKPGRPELKEARELVQTK